MAEPCLQAGVIEASGALSAIGFPVLLFSVSLGVVHRALGETGLSLVWRGLQSVGIVRGCLAAVALPAVGSVAAVAAVEIAGVKGVAAGAVATAAGACVSVIISAIVVEDTARRMREQQETSIREAEQAEFQSFLYTAGCGVLFGMGMSFIFDLMNRNRGRTNRISEDEEADEDHEMNAEDKQKSRRKKRNKRRTICEEHH